MSRWIFLTVVGLAIFFAGEAMAGIGSIKFDGSVTFTNKNPMMNFGANWTVPTAPTFNMIIDQGTMSLEVTSLEGVSSGTGSGIVSMGEEFLKKGLNTQAYGTLRNEVTNTATTDNTITNKPQAIIGSTVIQSAYEAFQALEDVVGGHYLVEIRLQ